MEGLFLILHFFVFPEKLTSKNGKGFFPVLFLKRYETMLFTSVEVSRGLRTRIICDPFTETSEENIS